MNLFIHSYCSKSSIQYLLLLLSLLSLLLLLLCIIIIIIIIIIIALYYYYYYYYCLVLPLSLTGSNTASHVKCYWLYWWNHTLRKGNVETSSGTFFVQNAHRIFSYVRTCMVFFNMMKYNCWAFYSFLFQF